MKYWYVSLNNSYPFRDKKVRSVQIKDKYSIIELTDEASLIDIDNCKLRHLGIGLWKDKHIQINYKKFLEEFKTS
ncbi:hypothetical protein AB6831_04240 [Carnobacterium divergens]|uniref:hypothetical protein n=1 Tax=Carnobacterium divergens TaxID=2748 RepID=UPI0039C97FC6